MGSTRVPTKGATSGIGRSEPAAAGHPRVRPGLPPGLPRGGRPRGGGDGRRNTTAPAAGSCRGSGSGSLPRRTPRRSRWRPAATPLDLGSKEAEKALKGRGKVTLVKKEPKKTKKAEETIRNEWAYEAHRNLKQARRAEQILYRSEAMGSTEKEKRQKYEDLNKQAARLIIKNAKKGEQWEKDLSTRMNQVMAKGKAETMESPAIQRAIGRYHDNCQKNKKKAMAEHERARAKMT